MHSHGYATAIALMGIPLFFQETKYYTDEARAEIRPILEVYRAHRDAVYRGIVYPIGDKPDNASWYGFQCHLPGENQGYLMIFRERCNPDAKHSIRLGWLEPGTIQVTDLLREETLGKRVRPDGAVTFHIEEAPGFVFCRYLTV